MWLICVLVLSEVKLVSVFLTADVGKIKPHFPDVFPDVADIQCPLDSYAQVLDLGLNYMVRVGSGLHRAAVDTGRGSMG